MQVFYKKPNGFQGNHSPTGLLLTLLFPLSGSAQCDLGGSSQG